MSTNSCQPGAHASGMVTGRLGRATFAWLVVFPALILSLAGCTGSSGPRSPAGKTAARASSAAPGTPAAVVCTRVDIRAAISDFFGAWNGRDAAALGRLFAVDGEFDLTTEHQDAVGGVDSWSAAGGGAGARRQIVAFAELQWRLGEKFSYRGIQIVLNGGESGNGGYAGNVVARFGDGAVQPMGFAKFIYSCASQAFIHVVIVSAKAASAA